MRRYFSLSLIALSLLLFGCEATFKDGGIVSGGSAAKIATLNRLSFTVSPAGSKTAGATFTITVKALDSDGVVFPSYRGTIHFTTTDAAGLVVLPVDYIFTTSDNGVHTFT